MLIGHSKNILGSFQNLAYVDFLRENMPLEERQSTMKLIEALAAADGVEHEMEVLLKSRFSKLLGLNE